VESSNSTRRPQMTVSPCPLSRPLYKPWLLKQMVMHNVFSFPRSYVVMFRILPPYVNCDLSRQRWRIWKSEYGKLFYVHRHDRTALTY
jgi:hypothetical protein